MLLSSFISFAPISTIIACNNPKINDEEPDIDKTGNLFNTIKAKIDGELNNSEKSKIYLDAKDLNMENAQIKSELDPIFKRAEQKEDVYVDNNIILDKITEEINIILNNLNNELKDIPALENDNKIQARMNGNSISTLLGLISDKDSTSFSSQNFAQDNNFDYNLQLKLEFIINLKNKQDSYIYNPKSAFITSNKKDLDTKIISLANKLSGSLANQELNGKNIINNTLDNNMGYIQSFSNELNNVLKDKNIKIEKSKNMEINREELSFQLQDATINFSKLINESESVITTSDKMFTQKDSKFYQFKIYEDKIQGNKIFTKIFDKFIVTKWSIEGIELPEKTLNNIKIYHEISEIKESWKNFYEILKYVFTDEILLTQGQLYLVYLLNDILTDNWSLSALKAFITPIKLLENWIFKIKNNFKLEKFNKKFSPKILAGSFNSQNSMYHGLNHKNGYSCTYTTLTSTTIQLFFNNLSFFIKNNQTLPILYRCRSK